MPYPNFVYIGPDKAGSTWLFKVLAWHPQTYVTPAKDLYFFDQFYERGVEWYARQFVPEPHHRIVAEISHDYLYDAHTPARMQAVLPGARLMVCLREPVSRAFSAYLYLRKFGLYTGTFAQALEAEDRLKERGRYAPYLEPFFDRFGRENVYVGLFDDLEADPNRFANDLFAFLGVDQIELPAAVQEKTLAAAQARSTWLTRLVKEAALAARSVGLSSLVGQIKGLPLVHHLLYKPFTGEEKPVPDPATAQDLRAFFTPEVERLDALLGTDLRTRWGYR
jgi:hypothetical protein